MIEIRRLNAEEVPYLSRMMSVVFNFRRDFAKEENQIPDPLARPPEWSWGAFDGAKLVSAMTEIEYLMRFDGHSVPMSGIGGVGTLPEARKGGHVRAIFEKLLPEAYEKGVIFSNLTPFSHSFYRKFGYETACARNNITIPVREFAHLKLKGHFTQIMSDSDTSGLNEVHRRYIADINHGICRDHWPDNKGWRIFVKDDPYATGTFVYLWQDDAGKNRGYIKYQDVMQDNEHVISVRELAFADPQALRGVLSIIGGLGAQFRKVQWLMPTFIDPIDLVNNPWEVEQRVIPRDMTRLINVKAALKMMRRPDGEGAYVIQVDDGQISANSGKFLVEYSPKETRVSPTQKDPHIRCDIPALSQLVTGYRTLENALLTRESGLEVYGNRDTLNQVFTLRPQHVTEYF